MRKICLRRLPFVRGCSALWLAAAAVAGMASSADAATWYRTTNVSNLWTNTSVWSNNPTSGGTNPSTAPSTGDTAVFNQSTVNGATTVRLNADQAIDGMIFANTAATTISGTTANRILTIGTGGVTVNAGAGQVSLGSNTANNNVAIALGGSQTWTNNSSSLLQALNGLTSTSGTQVLTIAGSGSTTIAGVIGDGSAGNRVSITKTGSGALRLNGNNTFTGGVTLNSGTLVLANNGALGTGTLTIGNSGVAIDGGSAGIAFSGTNAQVWNGDFTYLGSNGTLSMGAGAVAMNASRTITVNASTLTVNGVISGAGFGLTKAGPGTLLLGGSNTFTGPVTINSGTLEVRAAIGNGGTAGGLGAATSDAANLVINGGVLNWNVAANETTNRGITIGTNGGAIAQIAASNGLTLTGPLAFLGSGARTVTLSSLGSAKSNSWSADIGDGGGPTTVVVSNTSANGSSSWTLSGNLTFTGGLSVTGGGGVLHLSGTQNNFSGGVTVGAGSSLYLATNGGSLASNITNNGLIGSSVNSTSVTFSGVISGTGNVSSSGNSRSITLSAANSSYTGTTTVTSNGEGNTLTVTKLADGGSNSSIGASSSSAANLLMKLISLRYTGSGDSTDRLFTITGGGANANGDYVAIESAGTGPLSFTNSGPIAYGTADQTREIRLTGSNAGMNTFAPMIGDNGTAAASLTKKGTGTWRLSGNNTYTGTTGVTAGSLFINGNQSSATGAVSVAAGATLGGNGTIGGATTFSGASLLRPGSVGTDTGVLGFGSTLALSTTGTTFIDITGSTRGTLYDGVDIAGAVTYGGRLQFSIASADSATYNIFDFASQSGSFSTVTGTIGGTSLTFTNSSGVWTAPFTAGATSGTATFTQATGELVIVPEPGTLALAGIGIAAAVYCGLRRRR